MAKMTRLKGLADLESLRSKLPPAPQVGVVVPVPGRPSKSERLTKADIYYMGHDPEKTPIDESQLIGEFIEWLVQHHYLSEAVDATRLQQMYFKELEG